MKIYEAKLYALHPRIPYFTLKYLEKSMGEHKVKIALTDEANIGISDEAFIEKGKIYVRKRFLFLVEDIITGYMFPRIYIEKKHSEEEHSVKYKVIQTNQRLYAHLERQIAPIEVKKIYENCSDEYISELNKYLTDLFNEQKQYQQELPKTNRQYVKLLRQKRNKVLNELE